MQPPEIQLDAPGDQDLVQSLRDALGAEGRPPSLRLIRSWIQGGSLKVDGRVVVDPRVVPAAGARLDLEPRDDTRGHTGEMGSAAPLPVLHLDRHLLVVERPARTQGQTSLDVELEACLEAAAIVRPDVEAQLCPPIHPDATGLVLAPLSPQAAAALEEALTTGLGHLEVLVLTEGGVVSHVVGAGGSAQLASELAASGVEILPVPGPGPASRRPRALHVLAARIPHPRNDRPLGWQVTPPPWAPVS